MATPEIIKATDMNIGYTLDEALSFEKRVKMTDPFITINWINRNTGKSVTIGQSDL